MPFENGVLYSTPDGTYPLQVQVDPLGWWYAFTSKSNTKNETWEGQLKGNNASEEDIFPRSFHFILYLKFFHLYDSNLLQQYFFISFHF